MGSMIPDVRLMGIRWWAMACLLLAGCSRVGAGELGLLWERGAPWLRVAERPGQRLVLEHSDGLRGWREVARVTDQLFPYVDEAARGRAAGFYRLGVSGVGADDDWSNQLVVPGGALWLPGAGGGLAAMASVKWSILLDAADRVYFQESVKYPYHLQFARARLPGYGAMGAVAFGLQSLYSGEAQRMVLGSVFRAPDPVVREVGIEIAGAEAFPVERVAEWFETVRSRLAAPDGWRIYYMPSTEQRDVSEAARGWLAARGIVVSGLDRWVPQTTCYSEGWALGKLVLLKASEIPAALADGRLGLGDILVTDRVPSELPALAGTVSLTPATPNSHVVLLARSGLLPLVYAAGAGWRAELESLAGREVLLVAEGSGTGGRMEVRDTTGLLTDERRREILAMKRTGPLAVVPRRNLGKRVVPAEGLTPADVAYVGGKAAHFGVLRRALPDHSPHPAVAIPFDLWDSLMTRERPGGSPLGAFIAARMARHVYPPQMGALREDLTAIRDAILASDFTASERAEVMAGLWQAGLHGARIRFRSSTNLEDTARFSGAGLYDSFSGCLEDDADADAAGPSHCDPSESSERGVFRAIRKVFASFYNENAVIERLRHGVDESVAGMALLVHFSVPDEQEMANGVATVEWHRGNPHEVTVRIVSQAGADPVTNPESGATAEVVVARSAGAALEAASLELAEPSSLMPPGETVMRWTDDYRILLGQLEAASRAWEAYFPGAEPVELDFEYKKQRPGVIGLKQMRPVPRPVPVPPPTIP
jgi:hypothetical protein